jgi:hypothetical protein
MRKITLERIVGHTAVLFAIFYYTILVFVMSDVLFATASSLERFLMITGFFFLAGLHLVIGVYFHMLVYNSQRVQSVIGTIKRDIIEHEDTEITAYRERIVTQLKELVE